MPAPDEPQAPTPNAGDKSSEKGGRASALPPPPGDVKQGVKIEPRGQVKADTRIPPEEPVSTRDNDIPIPDFKLIRRIGSGAYGEVWLAQAITGALRAVKIVWREDFEYEKTFRREFEGIQQFEPISRGHPGLVNVLHVGWNDAHGFYYYVMELADDAQSGRDVDITTYVPRTLTTDFRNRGRIGLQECKETGIFLADALGYMHSHGLTHRDIKPSNIIYVKGAWKLADIGLVAVHGERSYVGTEGFVPPEGPGTFASDIYSLGKVLYEISSGKDRMEFPEVPEDLGAAEWNLWREWNTVICRACAPSLKERYASSADFAAALRMVGVPRPVPLSRRVVNATWHLAVGSVLSGALLAVVQRETAWSYQIQAPEAKKLTPEEIAQAKLPNPGRMWLNSFDMRFTWQKDRHVADRPVSLELFNQFLESTMQSFEGEVVPSFQKGGKPEYSVVVPRADATGFCNWLTDQDRAAGALGVDMEYGWRPDTTLKRSPGSQKNWFAMRLTLEKLQFGQVLVESLPPHAEVINNGEVLGTTPLSLSRMRVGEASFVMSLPGYKREILKGKVEEGKLLTLTAKMKPTDAVAFGRKWKNSLGMDFVPLGAVLMSATEIRRADYASYLRSVPITNPPPVDPSEDSTLPMTFVSRDDAMHYARWLTRTEQAKGLLEENQSYRLPTDDEWSMAAGLPRERGDTPAERNRRIEGFYPWGFIWVPPVVPGNLWDQSAADEAKQKSGIPGLNDGFVGLAPVGSFTPDARTGLRDLSGNVWEWVAEDFGGSEPKQQRLGVVRGGSWRTREREELLASYRRPMPTGTRNDEIGFRLVLGENGVLARMDE
ncbi:bifunctional serine/threonine-protein kinase/formylglycine-generating enzyme family protein [Verrucomicrobium spinosum]|uniref:bifunctional serine/threonine-protein kinase/formylglycine-generating enzyme family protein n=1 Tax=Verrucomicrobium spinosum TaxID=2736 RepID=UPI0001745071|nr:bifunctional serine/threonine-protein kinase/formylglycine-generating enzyme family protein [Verrucomicrobium spinosum]